MLRSNSKKTVWGIRAVVPQPLSEDILTGWEFENRAVPQTRSQFAGCATGSGGGWHDTQSGV